MARAITYLLAASLLAGCSTVGNVFKKTGKILMDPSIQVGTAEDQPTQVALSLYASPDVNPNPVSQPATDPEDTEAPSPARQETGPYAVSLRSASKDQLMEHLQVLLGHLQQEPAPQATAQAQGGQGQDMAAPEAQASHAPPAAAPPWPNAMQPLALGQYSSIPGLGPLTGGRHQAPSPATPDSATPIALRVLQLKDDSMLENADPTLLRQDPKKALGSTFLSSEDYTLAPGQFKFIEYRAIDENTRYIAVIADFHAPAAERWRDVFRLEPRGRKYPLMVMLQGTRIAITDESYRPSQDNACTATHTSKRP